jgi:hypothetical protein
MVPKQKISEEYGYMTVCLATEGNRIALHSMTWFFPDNSVFSGGNCR